MARAALLPASASIHLVGDISFPSSSESSSVVGGDSGGVLGYMLTSIQIPLQDGSMLMTSYCVDPFLVS